MEREFYDIQETSLLLDCRPKAVVKLAKELGWKTIEDKYGRVISFPVPEVQKEAKRRVGEKARLQSMGVIPIKRGYQRKTKRLTPEEKKRQYMCTRAKIRALQSGVEHNIDLYDVVIPELCPLLGVPLSFGGDRYLTPSLDRIHNSLGYVKGNVWVISEMANRMKQDASIEQLVTFAKNVLAQFDNT